MKRKPIPNENQLHDAAHDKTNETSRAKQKGPEEEGEPESIHVLVQELGGQ